MKVAEVKKLKIKSAYPGLNEISAMMDEHNGKLRIDTINWKGYNYKPEAELSIAYSDHEIFLKYYITENYFKAEKTETNQKVCEDSCVEFFVSPEDDGIYYNLEFNGIGTCLLGTGTARENSIRANFYKCGDKLSVPHYITWNPVGTEKPDYHQPKYFGLLKFV